MDFRSSLRHCITTPILLLLCEITPKAIGARANQLVATLTVVPAHFHLRRILRPVRFVLSRVKSLSSRFFRQRSTSRRWAHLKRVRVSGARRRRSQRRRDSSDPKFDLIKNVFELDDTSAEDILTPMPKSALCPPIRNLSTSACDDAHLAFSRIPIVA